MKINLYPPYSIHELGQRSNQEDSIYPALGKSTAADRLFLLCDGMGGHEHGEVASQTVCEVMAAYIQEHTSADEIFPDNTLAEALSTAYQVLDGKDDGGIKKMGTTLCFLYFHQGGVTAAHIGDSRIYHIRPSQGLLYQSRDHSLVYDLYQAGEISYEDMAVSPQKNIITRAIQPGEENRTRPDVVHITDIKAGDYFYLCSDGMLEQMRNDELYALLSSDKADAEKCSLLLQATSANSDNHSAHLLHVESVTAEAGDGQLLEDETSSRANAIYILPRRAAEPVEDVAVVAMPVRKSAPPKPVQPKKRRKLWPVVVIAVLAVICLLAFYFSSSGF